MKIWKMNTPDIVFSGRGSITNLGGILSEDTDYIKKIFVAVDKNVIKSTFFQKILNEIIKFKVYCFSEFSSDPEISEIEEGAKLYRAFSPDCVIAVGGGSCIDVTKAISLLAENYDSIDKCFDKMISKKEKFPYFIAIPTTCGTGAESSPFSIIKDCKTKQKKTIEREFFIPNVVILDANSLDTLDQKLKVATALDTLVHIIEVHTSKHSSALTRISTRGTLMSFKNCFEKAIFKGENDSLEELQYIAFTARILYPRTGLSIAHSIAHPFGAFSGIHHGMIVSAIMPEVIRYNMNYSSEHFEEVAHILRNNNKAESVSLWIEGILEKSGIYEELNTNLKDQKIDICEIAQKSLSSSNINSNPREIENVSDLEDVIEKVLARIYLSSLEKNRLGV